MATKSFISSQLLWKLQTENKILKQKNVILTERCQQYTSANKYITSCHKLQIDKHQYEANQLNQTIKSLNQSKRELTIKCNALRTKINNYRQKNKSLSKVQTQNKSLQKKLDKCHIKIKTLKQQNNEIKNELHNVKTIQITTRDQTIENLKIQMNKFNELFEKNKRRRTSSTIRLQMSDSKTYKTNKRLSESYSITDNKPRFFVDDSYNISPTPSVYRHNMYSKSRRRYTMDENHETSNDDNEYKHNKPGLYQNDTVHAYYIDGNEMSNINNQLSPSNSNNETQDLVILETYDFNEHDNRSLHSRDSSGSRSLSLRNSETQNVEDVKTVV